MVLHISKQQSTQSEYLKKLEGTKYYDKIISGLKEIENGKRDVMF